VVSLSRRRGGGGGAANEIEQEYNTSFIRFRIQQKSYYTTKREREREIKGEWR
jgi:hypothetical protein